MHQDTQLLKRLEQIRLVILDVDGTMTDGGVYLGDEFEIKRFDVHDGAGIVFLRAGGIEVAVISGRGGRAWSAGVANWASRRPIWE